MKTASERKGSKKGQSQPTVEQASTTSFKEQMAQRPLLLKKLVGFLREALTFKKHLRNVVGFRFDRTVEMNLGKAISTITEVVKAAQAMSTDPKQYLAPHKVKSAVELTERVADALQKAFKNHISGWELRAEKLRADIDAADPEIMHREGNLFATEQDALRAVLLDARPKTGSELDAHNLAKIDAYNQLFGHLYELSREANRLAGEAAQRQEREEIVEISSEIDDILKEFENF